MENLFLETVAYEVTLGGKQGRGWEGGDDGDEKLKTKGNYSLSGCVRELRARSL